VPALNMSRLASVAADGCHRVARENATKRRVSESAASSFCSAIVDVCKMCACQCGCVCVCCVVRRCVIPRVRFRIHRHNQHMSTRTVRICTQSLLYTRIPSDTSSARQWRRAHL
jgi:hypothetical protein